VRIPEEKQGEEFGGPVGEYIAGVGRTISSVGVGRAAVYCLDKSSSSQID
jgi:hypothetical protein